jgi:hypothetical protein
LAPLHFARSFFVWQLITKNSREKQYDYVCAICNFSDRENKLTPFKKSSTTPEKYQRRSFYDEKKHSNAEEPVGYGYAHGACDRGGYVPEAAWDRRLSDL